MIFKNAFRAHFLYLSSWLEAELFEVVKVLFSFQFAK